MNILIKGIKDSIINLNLNDTIKINKDLFEYIELTQKIKKDSFMLFARNKILNPNENFQITPDLEIYEVRCSW